eukprot:scaffold4242_cov175-Amphora_coffeaeformis.AAC.4
MHGTAQCRFQVRTIDSPCTTNKTREESKKLFNSLNYYHASLWRASEYHVDYRAILSPDLAI